MGGSIVAKKDEALALFNSGFNCSQSVAAAYAEDLGMSRSDVLRLSAAFGGGIGRTGQTCGAVSGALMVLGMKHGMTEANAQAKDRMYVIAQDFLKRVQAHQSSLLCNDILGEDITTAEGRASMRQRNTHASVCSPLIADITVMLDEMLGMERT
jgi:C_GCAxxG_C_C family probable redox protein